MTSESPPDMEPSLPATAPDASPQTLPFVYEDRTDGRHQRLVQEIRAAHAWVEGRRAQGLLPS